MNAHDHRHIADAPPDASPDVSASIASLRTAGADRFDPVHFRYIEALAERASSHRGSVKRLLDARLALALAAFNERFVLAQSDAREILDRSVEQYPHMARELRRRYDAGDFKGMRRLVLNLKPPAQSASLSLGALVRRLEQHVPENAEVHLKGHAGSRPASKTIRNFKNTLAKLSVHKQVAQALEQAPKNAGPINSHMLVLRSLALMRDISPDYLNRFISYADALLSLDQCEKDKTAAPKKSQAARTARK